MRETLKDLIYEGMFEYPDSYSLYYIGALDLLKSLFPREDFSKAVTATINIEVPKSSPEDAVISISPTIELPDGYEDYDWREIELSDHEKSFLLLPLHFKFIPKREAEVMFENKDPFVVINPDDATDRYADCFATFSEIENTYPDALFAIEMN